MYFSLCFKPRDSAIATFETAQYIKKKPFPRILSSPFLRLAYIMG